MATRGSVLNLREPTPARLRPFLLVALPLGLLGAWVLATGVFGANPLILPSPLETLRGLVQLVTYPEQDLVGATLVSTRRILIAVGLSALVALPLGVLMGAFDAVNRLFDPLLAPLRYMPISAFIPLLIAWFGIDEEQKIAFLFLGTFVYLLPAVVDAIRAVPDELVQTAYTLGASKRRVVTHVLVPASLPTIFDSFRTLNAIAWTYVILAEIVNPSGGLGQIFYNAYRFTKPAWSLAGLFVVGVIGLATDRGINAMNRLLFRWRE